MRIREHTDRPATTTAEETTVSQRVEPETHPDLRPEPRPDLRPEPPAPAGPRPRASVLATLSLVAGVSAALMVLTGMLAGYGLAVGVLALVLAIAGISATGRRHVAGKTDALIGLVLGLAAVVGGILVLTGSLPWLTMDAQPLTNLRQWLDTQFVNRF